MIKYIRADILRIWHKKSFLTAVGIFYGLYALLVFIYFNPTFTSEMYVSKITNYLSYFPLLVGILIFLSVYADDFKCKSMQVAIGYGFSRTKIIVSKLIECALLLLGIGAITALIVNIVPVLLGIGDMSGDLTLSLVLTVIAEMLRTIGYVAISAIAIFASQNAVGSIVCYVLLSTKTVYIVFSIILGQDIIINIVGDLTKYLYTSRLYLAKMAILQGEGFILSLIVTLLVYVIVPTVISAIVFRKKELEF